MPSTRGGPPSASRQASPALPVADIDLRPPRPNEELPRPEDPGSSGRRPRRLVGCLLAGVAARPAAHRPTLPLGDAGSP